MVFYPAGHDQAAPVMASAARPSILQVRGDGLPRFARSDGIFGLLFKVCVRYRAGFGELASQPLPQWARDAKNSPKLFMPSTVMPSEPITCRPAVSKAKP